MEGKEEEGGRETGFVDASKEVFPFLIFIISFVFSLFFPSNKGLFFFFQSSSSAPSLTFYSPPSPLDGDGYAYASVILSLLLCLGY